MLMYTIVGTLINYVNYKTCILIFNEALNSYTNLDTRMYNLCFVSQAVEMTKYFKPCNSKYMLFERLLSSLHLDVFNRCYLS
jgi:hypothetical protein